MIVNPDDYPDCAVPLKDIDPNQMQNFKMPSPAEIRDYVRQYTAFNNPIHAINASPGNRATAVFIGDPNTQKFVNQQVSSFDQQFPDAYAEIINDLDHKCDYLDLIQVRSAFLF